MKIAFRLSGSAATMITMQAPGEEIIAAIRSAETMNTGVASMRSYLVEAEVDIAREMIQLLQKRSSGAASRAAVQAIEKSIEENITIDQLRPKGGWCPVCEQEGKDPRHTRRTQLCTLHYTRAHRKTEHGRKVYEKHKRRYSEKRASPFLQAIKREEERNTGGSGD